MFALVDCNNFYASCERLFRPDLYAKPIVVLSSGDGCVIARSNEAKTLGIKMGEPYFKIKSVCLANKVQVFSSNFTLYRDLSQRVMSIIENAWLETEIYSIDEAFLDLSTMPPCLQEVFCYDLQKIILKHTGIPVSIGIGKSKTLAKVSNFIAKKILKKPVFNVNDDLEWLKKIDIGDVWGIGRQWQKKLTASGISTAYDLTVCDLQQLRAQFNVVLMRTAMELKGESCLDMVEVHEPKKTILSSRSFSQMQTEFDPLAQSVSMHCNNIYEKLRAQHSFAYSISVFLTTNRFRQDLAQYSECVSMKLITPTDDVRRLTQYARQCLKKIYKPGFFYKKVGVCLSDITENTVYQADLFQKECEKTTEKSKKFLAVLDHINARFGKRTIHLAALGFVKAWDTKFKFKSPAYTTRWSDLAEVKNKT